MSYPHTSWRILLTPPAPGDWNMAVDEALLVEVGAGRSLPTLRLFSWEPPCLSLGYAQPIADVDFERLAARGWGLVRRPTGGRAILHTDELTYSVISPPAEPRLAGGVLESYRRLATALLDALVSLGAPAQTDPHYDLPEGSDPKGAVCFEVPSNYEITAKGKKLIGSAQARRKEGILQHGSLPLTGDIGRITFALRYPDETTRQQAAKRVRERAATLDEVVQRTVTWQDAADAFHTSFSRVLNLSMIPTPLTAGELERIADLASTKFGHASWTKRI